MPTTTGVITIGTMSTVLSSRMPRNSRRQKSASASPSTVSMPTERATKRTVTQSALQELRVAPQLDVVVEADVAERLAEAIELGAGAQPVPKRVDQHGEHDQNARREQQVGQGQIEPRPLQPLAADRSRRVAQS